MDIPDTAKCRCCGYLLRGLSRPVCPECGTIFDPARPDTYHDPTRLRRRELPPNVSEAYLILLGFFAITVVCGRATWQGVFFFHHQVYSDDPDLACTPFRLLLAMAPLIDFLRRRIPLAMRRADGSPANDDVTRYAARCRLLGIFVILLYSALLYPWPGALRFYASWPWLSARADAYLLDPGLAPGPQSVGLWRVQRMWGRGQGFVWFQLAGDSANRYGIARYAVPPDDVQSGYHRPRTWLAPGWYFERW
jgi:hypothetical protein